MSFYYEIAKRTFNLENVLFLFLVQINPMEENIMKKLGLFALSLATLGGLASCNNTAASECVGTYIGKHIVEVTSQYQDGDGNIQTKTEEKVYLEHLRIFNDYTYEMVQHVGLPGMSYDVVYAEGTYTRGEKDATYYGYTQLDLGTATYVHLDTDIYNHMFALSIDSETSTFPAEQPGGMKINAKEDFINMYGVFGKRFIRHQVTVTETAKENWIDIESDIVVVE